MELVGLRGEKVRLVPKVQKRDADFVWAIHDEDYSAAG